MSTEAPTYQELLDKVWELQTELHAATARAVELEGALIDALKDSEAVADEFRQKWSCDISDRYLDLALAKEREIGRSRKLLAKQTRTTPPSPTGTKGGT